MCASMISASLFMYLDRTTPEAFRPHVVSNAFWAALTARSTSFAVASAIFVRTFPSAVGDRDQSLCGMIEMDETTYKGSQH